MRANYIHIPKLVVDNDHLQGESPHWPMAIHTLSGTCGRMLFWEISGMIRTQTIIYVTTKANSHPVSHTSAEA